MKQFIEAGEFVTTHGVMGELKLYPWCDGPEFVAALPRLFFTPEGGRETKVEAVRAHKGMCLVKLKGVDSIDAARPYIRKVAYFSRADVKLPEGRYFVQDIVGCTVKDADTGVEYGVITAVEHPAAIDVYTVEDVPLPRRTGISGYAFAGAGRGDGAPHPGHVHKRWGK